MRYRARQRERRKKQQEEKRVQFRGYQSDIGRLLLRHSGLPPVLPPAVRPEHASFPGVTVLEEVHDEPLCAASLWSCSKRHKL